MRKRFMSFKTSIVSFFQKYSLFSIFSARGLLVISLVSVLSVFFGVFSYSISTIIQPGIHHSDNVRTVPDERLINRDQSMKSLRTKIGSFNLEASKFDDFATKLKNAAGIGNTSADEKNMGVGGSFAKDIALLTDPTDGYNQWLKDVDEEKNRLDYKTIDQFDEYQVLLETVKEIKKIQDATPSVCPVDGGRISSSFGYRKSPFRGTKEFHSGLDISCHKGTPVKATADGIVRYSGYYGDLGKAIIIDHGFGIVTEYGHLSEIKTKTGQQVKLGDVIGKIGNTGRSTGPHLHYEVRLNNSPVNPKKYMPEYLASSSLSK